MVLKFGSRETRNRTKLRSVLVIGVYTLHACLVSPIFWEHDIFGVILTRASAQRGTNTPGRCHFLMYRNNLSLTMI